MEKELLELLRQYDDGEIGIAYLDNELWHLYNEDSKSPESGLVPIDYDKHLKPLFDDVYNRKIISHYKLKEICSKFGQPRPAVPSVEDIEKCIWDLENRIRFVPAYRTIAEEIHRLLSKGQENEKR